MGDDYKQPFVLVCEMEIKDAKYKDHRYFTFTTMKQHFDVRVTPTGLIRLGDIKNGRFPYEAWEEPRDAE